MTAEDHNGGRRARSAPAQLVRRDLQGTGPRSSRQTSPGGSENPRPPLGNGSPRSQMRGTTNPQTPGLLTPPYGFVPVVPRVAVTARPVFHHGANPDQAELLSGEIRLTIRTLTPLLIGHDRYQAKQAKGSVPASQGLVHLPAQWEIPFPVDGDKSIIEPLRLDGRVLIPGSALTGMLRHSLGALLSAPMERVTERTYSYRPNIAHVDPKYDPVLYASRPAIVCATDPVLKVLVLPEARSAVFLKGGKVGPNNRDDHWVWRQIGSPSAGDPVNGSCPEVKLDNRNHLIPDAPGGVQTLSHFYFAYRGGMDGSGDLARLFNPRSKTYHHALVRADHHAMGVSRDVHPAILQRYLDTQCHLIDTTSGHLSPRHPLATKEGATRIDRVIAGIKASKKLKVGQLIYVEVEIHPTTQEPMRVTSLGHNHHYRVRYTDSVREVWNGAGYEPRSVLAPLECEKELAPPPDPAQRVHAPPAALSAARLLFGYASSDAKDSGTTDIGKGDFRRLAGRLAFNMAVEQVDDPQDLTRFLDGGRPIPLRVLGQPRPSAVEFYLDQSGTTGGLLRTYGDLPDQWGAAPNGRKDYPHQPDAAVDPSIYRLDGDLDALDGCPEKDGFLQSLRGHTRAPQNAEQLPSRAIALTLLEHDAKWIKRWEKELSREAMNEQNITRNRRVATAILHSKPIGTFIRAIEHLQGNQAALARYVLKPGAIFRCTLRFRDLRPWELGAVLLALEPRRIASVQQQRLPSTDAMEVICAQARSELESPGAEAPLFGQKLGGARPLGLGSASFAIDQLSIWDGEKMMPNGEHAPGPGQGVVAVAFERLGKRLEPMGNDPRGAKVLESWLRMHRYRGQPRRDYPREQDQSSGRYEIYVSHTNCRRAHAKQRRVRKTADQ